MEHSLLTCRTNMRAAIFSTSLSIALLAAAPAVATAQTMTAQIQPYNGRSGTPSNLQDITGGQPVSREECMADLPIEVQLTNVPTTPATQFTLIDVWSANSTTTSANCQTASVRNPSGGSASVCTHVTGVAENIDGRATFTMSLSPSALFATTAMPDPCSATTAQTRTFYLFPAPGENDITNDFTRYATITITLDPEPPSAPVIDGASAGDVSIDVTFDAPSSQIFEARLYVDPAGCADGMTVNSTILVAGGDPPDTMPAATNQASSPSSITVSGESLGLAYGESAAVAATFVDRARNESVLSNPVCVTRVQVSGFWDRYCSEHGMSVEECSSHYGSCAAVPGSGGRGSWALAPALGAIALLLARGARRRRNR